MVEIHYVSPSLHRGGDMLVYICPLSALSFLSIKRFPLCSRRPSQQTQDVAPMLAHRQRRWANIIPVLGYHVVLGATLYVGQPHRRRANINSALVQSIVPVPPAWSTDYGGMNTGQHRRRWSNI